MRARPVPAGTPKSSMFKLPPNKLSLGFASNAYLATDAASKQKNGKKKGRPNRIALSPRSKLEGSIAVIDLRSHRIDRHLCP